MLKKQCEIPKIFYGDIRNVFQKINMVFDFFARFFSQKTIFPALLLCCRTFSSHRIMFWSKLQRRLENGEKIIDWWIQIKTFSSNRFSKLYIPNRCSSFPRQHFQKPASLLDEYFLFLETTKQFISLIFHKLNSPKAG